MAPTTAVRTLVLVMVGVALIGAFDAGRDSSWDLVVLFGALALGLVVLFVAVTVGRPLVAVRADLVRWMGRRAAVAGERPGSVADRAIAAYRAELTGPSGSSGSDGTDRERSER